jgi:activator of 2-hydroxyglutaryl-CoA dehydratase
MIYTVGIDVGSTYTKAVILSGDQRIVGKGMVPTGFKLVNAATTAYHTALAQAHLTEKTLCTSPRLATDGT